MIGNFVGEILLGILVLLVARVPAPAVEPAVSTTGVLEKPRIILVELFTSEGCSSCPPADALLRQLNGTQTAAGQLIVGISEHVTYWNSLGWSDPYSSSIYTERQKAYGKVFHLESVYTPQMVINGEEQIVGSDKLGLARAVRSEDDKPQLVSVRIISTTFTGSSLTIDFSAAGAGKVHDAGIVAVLADDVDQSTVLHGENAGKTLVHVAVARFLQRVAELAPGSQQTVQIFLPPSFRRSQEHHLILFAQSLANGRVLGGDTKALYYSSDGAARESRTVPETLFTH